MGVQQFSDDDLLTAIRLRTEGHSLKQVAAHFGRTVGFINAATNRVKKQYLATVAPERVSEEAAGFW